MTRREMLAGAAVAGVALSPATRAAVGAAKRAGVRVAMCDWSMGRTHVGAMELAKGIGLDGVEVSIGFPADNLQLRQPKVQQAYLAAAKKHGLAMPSVAMGVLNNVPLMSEPKAALWVADTIDATRKLGAKVILLAFFGTGELKEENKEDMRRVTEVVKELAPRAEKAGVVLGLETYLRAEALISILDQVKSKAVQVYYDVYNAAHKKYDVLKEIRLLGRERICQVHFKEGSNLLGAGKIDWPAVAAELERIKYAGWLVLETSSPNDVVKDTQTNLAYLRGLFDGDG